MKNKKEVVEKLKELQKHTNKVIEELQKEKNDFDEDINWGNLKCIEANFCINQRGFEYYNVTISEASPYATIFQEEVYNRLLAIWNEPVIVQTEW